MKTIQMLLAGLLACCVLNVPAQAMNYDAGVRLKELARIQGVRDNPLTGYGLVIGLSGSGDSARNSATLHSVANVLKAYNVDVSEKDLSSKNVAAVMVTARLPAFSEVGDKLDVSVSSLGDAKSLLGGTLLLTPLKAANQKIYALAQGPVSIGGYKYDMNNNAVQKNHPTVGKIPDGANVERATHDQYVDPEDGTIVLLLYEPDFTTAQRIVEALRPLPWVGAVNASHAGKVLITPRQDVSVRGVSMIAKLENVLVAPDRESRIVINERTGTIVAGGDILISNVSISHGDLKVRIDTDYLVSQPAAANQGVYVSGRNGAQTVVVPNTVIDVKEGESTQLHVQQQTRVADLVDALRKIKLTTREIISILQSIKRAGALHAQLIIE